MESNVALKLHVQECYTEEVVITFDLCSYWSQSQYEVWKHKLITHGEDERDVKEEQMANDKTLSELELKTEETVDCEENNASEQKVNCQECETHYCDLCDFIASDRKFLEEHLASEH